MESVNIHEAKTRLPQLVARLTRYDSPGETKQKRLGFLTGEFKVPDDFDRMGQDEITPP